MHFSGFLIAEAGVRACHHRPTPHPHMNVHRPPPYRFAWLGEEKQNSTFSFVIKENSVFTLGRIFLEHTSILYSFKLSLVCTQKNPWDFSVLNVWLKSTQHNILVGTKQVHIWSTHVLETSGNPMPIAWAPTGNKNMLRKVLRILLESHRWIHSQNYCSQISLEKKNYH